MTLTGLNLTNTAGTVGSIRCIRRQNKVRGMLLMTAAGEGFPRKTKKFLREVRAELKKVTWPSKNDLTTYTIVVLISVLIVSGIIWIADSVLYKLLSLILR
jgi:preprotein translocase subunit SecE